ncbi:Splicing factor 45-like [Homarus americanus]|uniref:Splicing factor 45 n=1 Tax=Homarus americanus TaxID=6706 RepID=A0A8J5MVS6_HOMAM|nr:Splicing factor 45-like [Homarus americanus]
MSLYDDIDTDKASGASGWASGIKLMHNQLAFKKATITTPKRDQTRRVSGTKLPPVIDLKSRREDDENTPPLLFPGQKKREIERKRRQELRRERKEKGKEEKEEDQKRRQVLPGLENQRRKKRKRSDREEVQVLPLHPLHHWEQMMELLLGFPQIKDQTLVEGQGLGKSEQGIVRALEVEKTSKRGGRIVLEREDSPGPPTMPPPVALPPPRTPQSDKPEAKMAHILRNPSKVALLRNMVGPGEVDDELEPEVREECNGKYGAVVQVVIFEIPRAVPEEAVRIFVEFQRVESAIKAVIDLNGRFFGGRQVKAGFYDHEDFKAYKLNERCD